MATYIWRRSSISRRAASKQRGRTCNRHAGHFPRTTGRVAVFLKPPPEASEEARIPVNTWWRIRTYFPLWCVALLELSERRM
ncbi:hypothetical protein JG688_00006383 [Phytophthora aleatoria]|uniref:Uncharacterized protein n=1 Tax=Phytophthora aleatoria TaxID=2496075 RepID=A0A8J5J8U1_9STRA|nr:hypothetical protein JG688_00006383 [Phytophthora aleatoria]